MSVFDVEMILPGSKSISNRVLMMAALADQPSVLNNIADCDDVETCRQALLAMYSHRQIDCRDSGIVTRFLLPLCAALGGEYYFDGSVRMRERPIGVLLEVLQAQNVQFKFLDKPGRMPLILNSQGLRGGEIFIVSDDSSQFLSGLLMAAPLASQDMILISNVAFRAQPYVMMTLKLMAQFGIQFDFVDEFSVHVRPQKYQAVSLFVEPDASTASYFFAAAALMQGAVTVSGLSYESLQGDVRFLEILECMGCEVSETLQGIRVLGPSQLLGIGEIDMMGFSDVFMTLAVLAPFLPTPTKIMGLRHARLQESDRVVAMAEGLARVGVRTEIFDDALMIYPGPVHGAVIDSYQDHRIAMSFAVLGLKVPGIKILGVGCVSKTCPHFFELLASLRGGYGQ